MRDERRMTATAGTPTTASIFASRQTPVVACVGEVIVFYVTSDTSVTSGPNSTCSISCGFVVQQAVQQNPQQISSRAVQQVRNRSATNRQSTTNAQHLDISRYRVRIHAYNKSATNPQQIDQLYKKSATFHRILQLVVQQIHN